MENSPNALAPGTSPRAITFRSSLIIYYGPHACSNCGALICKMGHEFGGNAFNYPTGPIYPNTEWAPHVCNPATRINHTALTGQIGSGHAPDPICANSLTLGINTPWPVKHVPDIEVTWPDPLDLKEQAQERKRQAAKSQSIPEPFL